MCGIAGYFGTNPPSEQAVSATLELMRRRGPDFQDSRTLRHASGHSAVLLHTRLSIIDLDARSNQPFSIGSYTLIFNGELYNYREIRAELVQHGCVFHTESDTEVLLQAWIQWGEAALDKFEGMWAFAVFDQDRGTVTLCRDRFGEKPLYYIDDARGLYFASEVKDLFSLSGQSPDINWSQVYRFLVNGYKSLYKKPDTFFGNVNELAPGTVRVSHIDSRIENRRFWHPTYAPDQSMTFDQAVEGARERLIRSVQLRLRSDVPLAFCMSGGIDSVALISIAKKIFDYDVHGFTVVNDDERYDEWDLVDATRAELGIRHTSVPVDTTDFLARLRTLVNYHDAPVYTITYYAHWLLQKAVAENGYKISISGTAADEIFTGYYDHHLMYLNAVQSDPALLAQSTDNWMSHVKPIVRNPFLQNPRAFIENPMLRDHIYLDADGFREFLVKPWEEAFAENEYASSLLRNRMLNELLHEATPQILHEDDLNTMYYSVENRSPFLDRSLVEFGLRIPDRHLVRDGKAKVVLREAIRSIAPDAVVDNRRKVGFNAPIEDFLDFNSPATRSALLEDSPIFEHIRRDKIEDLLRSSHLPNSKSKFLFYFISTKFFVEGHLS